MINRKGFTLIELMVVVFIVGILAAVAIPIMRGRIDAAKWSEGKAAAGSIRTAARAFCAERGPAYTYDASITLCELGFDLTTCTTHTAGNPSDLDGKYFSEDCYSILFTAYDMYTITVDATKSTTGEEPAVPTTVTLDQDGKFTES
jgi:prepilin-type N-terminal cleavage/methylation domain-containing protein